MGKGQTAKYFKKSDIATKVIHEIKEENEILASPRTNKSLSFFENPIKSQKIIEITS